MIKRSISSHPSKLAVMRTKLWTEHFDFIILRARSGRSFYAREMNGSAVFFIVHGMVKTEDFSPILRAAIVYPAFLWPMKWPTNPIPARDRKSNRTEIALALQVKRFLWMSKSCQNFVNRVMRWFRAAHLVLKYEIAFRWSFWWSGDVIFTVWEHVFFHRMSILSGRILVQMRCGECIQEYAS